jgi:hypothetical protein
MKKDILSLNFFLAIVFVGLLGFTTWNLISDSGAITGYSISEQKNLEEEYNQQLAEDFNAGVTPYVEKVLIEKEHFERLGDRHNYEFKTNGTGENKKVFKEYLFTRYYLYNKLCYKPYFESHGGTTNGNGELIIDDDEDSWSNFLRNNVCYLYYDTVHDSLKQQNELGTDYSGDKEMNKFYGTHRLGSCDGTDTVCFSSGETGSHCFSSYSCLYKSYLVPEDFKDFLGMKKTFIVGVSK